MAEAKQLKALRITSKHGTEVQWAALETPYIPNSGEIIVFDADFNFTEPRIKVGDGVSSAIELPFVSASEIYIGTEQPADDSSYKIFIKTDEDYITEETPADEPTTTVSLTCITLSPESAVQGELSEADFTTLTTDDTAYICLNGEYYYLSDNNHTQGVRSYTHNGWNGKANQDKSINITLNTKAWTLAVGNNKYYRHYIQLTADGDKTLFYDFSSTQETAYTATSLPVMPDASTSQFTLLTSGYYSNVNGQVYRDSDNNLKVIAHGIYTTNGTSITYLSLTGSAAMFVKDEVVEM